MTRTLTLVREQLRAPFTLALLVVIPVLFVVSAAGALGDVASALGGSLAGDAAVGLSARRTRPGRQAVRHQRAAARRPDHRDVERVRDARPRGMGHPAQDGHAFMLLGADGTVLRQKAYQEMYVKPDQLLSDMRAEAKA